MPAAPSENNASTTPSASPTSSASSEAYQHENDANTGKPTRSSGTAPQPDITSIDDEENQPAQPAEKPTPKPSNNANTDSNDMNQINLFGQQQDTLTSDDFYTPQWIFDALNLHFDLDVASPPHETRVPCDRYLTKADDGLTADWHGRIWLNPPFSNTYEWTTRFIEHSNGIALLPFGKSRAIDAMWQSDANVVLLPRTMKFLQGPIYMPTALWAIGDDNINALHNIGTVR